MAVKTYLVDIDLAKNSLNNARIQNLATDPANPVAGQQYFNTSTGRLRVFDGTIWTEMGSASDAGVSSVNGRTGAVVLSKTDVSLSNVDNTSDASKPISTATQTALDGKLHTVVAGTNVTVDNTDPLNPILSTPDWVHDVTAPAGSHLAVDTSDRGSTHPEISLTDVTGMVGGTAVTGSGTTASPYVIDKPSVLVGTMATLDASNTVSGDGAIVLKPVGASSSVSINAPNNFYLYGDSGTDGSGAYDKYVYLDQNGATLGTDTAGLGVTLIGDTGVNIQKAYASASSVRLNVDSVTTQRTLNLPDEDGTVATEAYVDSHVPTIADATTTSKGIVQLAGDLAGTAAAPTVPALATKANDSAVVHNTGTETIAGAKTFSSALSAPNLSGNNTGDQQVSISGEDLTVSGANGNTITLPIDSRADARIAAAAGVSIASLSGGKIPTSQLPAIAITSTYTATSDAAMLALTTQEGDVVIRTDLNKTYIHNAGTSGTVSDFTLLATPTDAVTSVNGQTGIVTLVKADVGLGSVDNTADVDKPVSTAQQTAISARLAAASNLSDVADKPTAFANIKQAASTTVTGVVELATVTEAKTKASSSVVVTPAGLASFAQKYSATIGDGTATSIAVAHGLATPDVQVQVYTVASGDTVEVDVTRTDSNTVTITTNTAPALNSLRVVIIG